MHRSSSLRPYDFMVKYTPQDAWIEAKGMYLWLAFFFSEIGAGLYLVSLFLDFRTGWLVGWMMTLVLGGGLHLLYLGKPMRAPLMFLKPGKSELSRGLWVILAYAAFGFFQIAPVLLPGVPWSGTSPVLKGLMGIICILIMAHGFLTMSVIRALPLWNSAGMIPLSVISGISVGSQFVVMLSGFLGEQIGASEMWARWSLFFSIGFVIVFLLGGSQSSPNARASVRRLLSGRGSVTFYAGVIGAGMVVPVLITLSIWGGRMEEVGMFVLIVRWMGVMIGDLAMRYGIMRCGHYSPLV